MSQLNPGVDVASMSPREVIERLIALKDRRSGLVDVMQRDWKYDPEIASEANKVGDEMEVLERRLSLVVPSPSPHPTIVVHGETLAFIHRFPRGGGGICDFAKAVTSDELRWPEPEPAKKEGE